MVDGGKTTESGGRSTEGTGEHSMVPLRLIPALDSPPYSAQPAPELVLDDTGRNSESLDRKCAPSQVPRNESANYGHFSYEQLYELRKQRGYHKKDAKAAVKTRLEAMDAVDRGPTGGAANAMDTSSSALGKRTRHMDGPLTPEPPEMGINGKRSRGDALEIAVAADASVAQEHAP